MKKLLTTAIAVALTSGAAQAAPTVYGAINVGVSSVDAHAANEDKYELGSYSSKIGVKGSEDLGNGISGIYKVEIGVDMDGDDNDDLSTYNTIVGLKGQFGTVFVGKHDTPYKLAGSADLFANTAADSQKNGTGIIGRGASKDTGWDNRGSDVVAYVSPDFGPVHFAAAGVVNEDTGTSPDLFDATSVAAIYKQGNINASAAYEVNTAYATDFSAMKVNASMTHGNIKVGGTYEVSDFYTVSGTTATLAEADVTSMLGSVAYTMGDITLMGQYGSVDTATKFTRMTFGASHKLAKSTTLYAGYNIDDNGSAEDQSTMTMGVNHSF